MLLALAAVCFLPSLGAQTRRAAQLSPEWQQKAYPDIFARDLSYPKIERGYMLSFHRTMNGRVPGKSIYLYSLANSRESQIVFTRPNAPVIWIDDVGVSSDQSLLIAGSSGDRRSVSHFIAKVDLTGNTLAAIDLGQYEPARVCSTDDGTIWTLGQDWAAHKAGKTYPVLRNYSLNGQLLRSYLDRQSLNVPAFNWSAREHFANAKPGRTFLSCGKESVGAYIGPATTWIEVQLSNGNAQTWKVKLPRGASRITGLALVGNHQVYGSFNQTRTRKRGLYRLGMARPKIARWRLVKTGSPASSANQAFLRLVGNDGPSLVYTKSHATAANHTPVMFWSKP